MCSSDLIREMDVGYVILYRVGLSCQISGQKNDPIYIKQFLHSRLGLKTLISHDLVYAEVSEAKAA